MLFRVYLDLRGRVHDKRSQNINNFVECIPDFVLIDQRQDATHEQTVEQSYFLAIFVEFAYNFWFLSGRRSHFLRYVMYPFNVVGVSPISECCEDIGKRRTERATA